MNLQEEIAKTAYELYVKSGYIGGRDVENWVDAERIVLTRHASQDIEEPEGDEPITSEEGLVEEIEGTAIMQTRQSKEEDADVADEMEFQSPAIGSKEYIEMRTEKIRPPKKAAAKKAVSKKAAAKKEKVSPKKAGRKSSEKFL